MPAHIGARRAMNLGAVTPGAGGGVGLYTRATDYVFSSFGTRFPNKRNTLGSGFAKYGGYTSGFRSAPWTIPAGSSLLIGIPNSYSVEVNGTEQERLINMDAAVEAVSVSYVDAGGTTRVAAATILSNGGVLSSTIGNGGVIASIPLAYAIPPGSNLKIGMALSTQEGGELLSRYDLRSGDLWRKSASNSFAAAINSGASPNSVVGNQSASINGVYPGPALIMAVGSDGRPVMYIDGDSIADGKGTSDLLMVNHIGGVVEPGLARNDGTYAIPCSNFSIAATGFTQTDPTNANYTPGVHNLRRALVDQVTAMNGGRPPFSHFFCEHGANSVAASGTEHIRLIKTRHAWLKAWYDLPVVQSTMLQKVNSSDGFKTYAGQTPNGDAGTRSDFRDKLLGDKLDGTVLFGVDTYGPLAFDETTIGRRRVKILPFSAVLTRDIASGASTLFLSKAPRIGSALTIGSQNRIVNAVTTVTADVEYQVGTEVGGSTATYPATLTGGEVREIVYSDGDTTNLVGHVSRATNDDIAAAQGPNSFDAMKAALKTAAGGAWAA